MAALKINYDFRNSIRHFESRKFQMASHVSQASRAQPNQPKCERSSKKPSSRLMALNTKFNHSKYVFRIFTWNIQKYNIKLFVLYLSAENLSFTNVSTTTIVKTFFCVSIFLLGWKLQLRLPFSSEWRPHTRQDYSPLTLWLVLPEFTYKIVGQLFNNYSALLKKFYLRHPIRHLVDELAIQNYSIRNM